MPGGSGLLQQICGRFEEVVTEAGRIAAACPLRCERSCIDGSQRYRNAFYHRYLNRHVVVDRLREWGGELEAAQVIPAKLPPSLHRRFAKGREAGADVKVGAEGAVEAGEAEDVEARAGDAASIAAGAAEDVLKVADEGPESFGEDRERDEDAST